MNKTTNKKSDEWHDCCWLLDIDGRCLGHHNVSGRTEDAVDLLRAYFATDSLEPDTFIYTRVN